MGGWLKESRRAEKFFRSLLKHSVLERSDPPFCNDANPEVDVGPSAFVFIGGEQYGSTAPLAEASGKNLLNGKICTARNSILELKMTLIAKYKCYMYFNPAIRRISKRS